MSISQLELRLDLSTQLRPRELNGPVLSPRRRCSPCTPCCQVMAGRVASLAAALLLVAAVSAQRRPEAPQTAPPPRPGAGARGEAPKPTRPQAGKMDAELFGERFEQEVWKLKSEHAAEGHAGVFAKLDTDGDGTLHPTELRDLGTYLNREERSLPARKAAGEDGTPTGWVSKNGGPNTRSRQPLDLLSFKDKIQPLLDRVHSDENLPVAKIFRSLDKDSSRMIDGDELTNLFGKVSATLNGAILHASLQMITAVCLIRFSPSIVEQFD